MSLDTLQPQQLGHYEILEKIAEGGMGAVYKGRSLISQEIVAIKVIPPETARNSLLLKRFEQEFRAASLIDHPNVVRAVDYCDRGPTPFLVMEFVDGESLGQRVERDGPLEEAEAIRLMSQVCEGLRRAHKQGLVHRDVKPDNIMVTHDGSIAKLTDLGLVKDLEGELNLTKTGRGLGTPHYMAPEQFRNAKGADERCDIYSLGATLYMLVTGVVPFDKTSPLDCWLKKTKNDFPKPIQLRRTLSQRVNWAICRAMSADPAQRPASCREFMEDLLGTDWRSQQNSDSILTTQPPPAEPDLWYMVYRDEKNQPRTVKGNTDSIRKNLVSGALGDASVIVVSRSKTGQFQPLRNVPEFRDLLVGSSETLPSYGVTPSPARLVNTIFNPPSGKFNRAQTHAEAGPASGKHSPARPEATPESRPVIPGLNIQVPDRMLVSKQPELPPLSKVDYFPWLLIVAALGSLGLGLLFFMR